jgi:transcriptional regulator with XRE-family HTH domain
MLDYRKFGDQPLIHLMHRHRYSYTLLADQIGVSRAQLVYAARGISAPSPELRSKLSNFFGVTPGELFTPAALAAKYNEGMARGGKHRWRGAGSP